MKLSEINNVMRRSQELFKKGMQYLGSDKAKAKFYFRLAIGEMRKLEEL